MSLPDDEALRARFHELRDEDRADAPSCRELLARAEASARAPRRAGIASGIWMSVAASLILAVGIAVGRSRDVEPARLLADQRSDTSAVASISAWTSPTMGLLLTSGHELLSPPPILGSVLDGLARASGTPPGD